MLMLQCRSALAPTLWGLLLVWAFFGGLVLAEQVQLIPETAALDSGAPDLDAEALAELGSGLKPNVPSLDVLSCSDLASIIAELALPITSLSVHQPKRLMLHDSLTRPLYQRLSVYRI
jgi:hypothetical protein